MKNDLIGSLLIFIILIFIELIDFIRILIRIMMKNNVEIDVFYWLINLMCPSLNGKRLVSIILRNSSKNLCQLIENDQTILLKIGFHKELNVNDFFKHLFISLSQIFLSFFFLCLIDMKMFNIDRLFNRNDNQQFNEDELDEDVRDERIRLLSQLPSSNDQILCLDLTKKYAEQLHLTINHLTFAVRQGECFALLGFNGAGKH